ncbi:hypothetical protein B0H11DRAFT_2031342 [Mycena galericulata]|nr:hypothetical protein B0H11DRAFT_2031342 [Mycena galericulata]
MPVLGLAISPPTSENITASGHDTKTVALPPDVQHSDGKSADPPLTVSRISLDLENIGAEIASDLASSLVAHILFLKNQVPFPIMQLYRIPNGKSNPRALKLRTDLLASYDTLSSHLGTTFSALSTAFALTASPDAKINRPTRRAYLAILVGPSIGSAKTKVMFAVDGLVAKIWGERDDLSDSDSARSDEEESDEEEEEESDDDDEQGSEPESDDAASSPPPSRSPSPSPCISGVPEPQAAPPVPLTQTQQTLRTANRLLSHTLATAEHSMSAELAPSQTHILVRAPRRFVHPAWIPRQTASATLDGVLREFREEARDETLTASDTRSSRKPARSKAQKVEGAWVTCRSPGVEFFEEATSEDDEMIWWSWDGKLVGFADW